MTFFSAPTSTAPTLSATSPALIRIIGIGDAGCRLLRFLAPRLYFRSEQNLTLFCLDKPNSAAEIFRAQQFMCSANLVFMLFDAQNSACAEHAEALAAHAKTQGILLIGLLPAPMDDTQTTQPMPHAFYSPRAQTSAINTLISLPAKKENTTALHLIHGISAAILERGVIGVDFADVRTVFNDLGHATVSIAEATGVNRAHAAVHAALTPDFLRAFQHRPARAVFAAMVFNGGWQMADLEHIGNALNAQLACDSGSTFLICDANLPDMAETLRVLIVAGG